MPPPFARTRRALNTSPSSTVRRKRRRIFITAAVVMGTCAAILCAEAALRIHVAVRGWTPNCYVTGLVFFVPDTNAGYTLRPNLRLKSSTYDVTVNALGLRGPEITPAKPVETRRIAVLGGSSVFGYLVPDGMDSCRIMETNLADRGIRVEVLNAGVPGYNMTQCLHRLEHQVSKLKPDMVILYLGWNDTKFAISQTPDALDKTPPAPAWSQRVLSRSMLYGFLRYRIFPAPEPLFAPPASPNMVVTDLGAKSFKRDLQMLLESIRASGATPVISTQVMASNQNCRGMDSYLGDSENQIAANRKIGMWITSTLRNTAAETGVQLIDCAAEVECNSDILGDAIHLTAEGHRQVAEVWAESLLPALIQPEGLNTAGQHATLQNQKGPR